MPLNKREKKLAETKRKRRRYWTRETEKNRVAELERQKKGGTGYVLPQYRGEARNVALTRLLGRCLAKMSEYRDLADSDLADDIRVALGLRPRREK